MGGKDIPGKSDIFYVDDLGITVTRTKIMKVLKEKFKAIPIRTILLDGSTKRALKISIEALERIKASYEDPWEIKILSTEDTSDQVNQPNQVKNQYDRQNKDGSQEEELASHEEDELENTSDNPENDQKEALESG
jgi:hypothetical protein